MSKLLQMLFGGGDTPYDDIIHLYKNGNPTVVNEIASGFSDNDYFYFDNSLNTPFEFKIKLKITSNVTIGEMYGFLGHSNMYGIMSLGVRDFTGANKKVDVMLSNPQQF